MRTVEIRVKRASLADTLGAMREWFDSRRCAPSHFRQAGNVDGTIVISVGFTSNDDTRANEFRKQFDGAPGVPHRAVGNSAPRVERVIVEGEVPERVRISLW